MKKATAKNSSSSNSKKIAAAEKKAIAAAEKNIHVFQDIKTAAAATATATAATATATAATEKKFYLDKYLNKGSVAYDKSCARKMTELLSIKDCTLNELIAFAQNFYDTLEKDMPIEKRCIWMTGRTQIADNGTVKKDSPQSTLNKHINWLWKTQAICVKRNGANYFIDMM